ncbi:MAG: neutral/alkaline non-lysosomal ceramidase N-terminal domain-containing protein [Isosphaeraceae bacterium]
MSQRSLAFWVMIGLWTVGVSDSVGQEARAGWQAGTAKAAITPKQPMWMSGYASRTRPSEGAVHDLWAKALALQDPAGRRAVLITLDICGIDRALSIRIRDTLQSRHDLGRDRIVLSCSHTHCGPVVGTNLLTMYKIDDDERRRIAEYAKTLEIAIVGVAGEALSRLQDARITWGNGRCDFAVNRRTNREGEVPKLRQRVALQGPDDHDVPVLRVARPDGKPLAVVFGYACHCTVLDFNKFCGDYAGFAQVELEARYPGATAMFVAGCGGDQNPIPRRSLDLAATYGKQLAGSVASVLAGHMQAVDGSLESAYEEIPLAFAGLPTREQIERDASATDFYVASRARHLLKTIETRGRLEPAYPYPVQAWRLGGLTWFFLGGEVVVDFSLRIKRNLGSSHTWVSAYCNDVMAYIPSKRVLKEGGYEGATAMIYYGQPSPWSEQVEESIIEAVGRVSNSVGREHPTTPAVSPLAR